MKVLVGESQTVYVQDDDGREIVTLTVGKIPSIVNGYGVELAVARGESPPGEFDYVAATKPAAA